MLYKRYCKSAQRGIFLLQEASAFSEWNKGLCSWLLESHDPCNWYFMANLRVYFRWLMVTFLSHQSETDCTFSYTQLWNFDFLYLKSYSGLASTKIPSAKLPFHQTEWKCIRHSDTLVWPHIPLYSVNPNVTTIRTKPKATRIELPIKKSW